MQPLGFVNWRHVNRYFCAFMWTVVFVLALVVLSHLFHSGAVSHASQVVVAR
ncbi:MAG: hypothetical protein ACYDHH_09240 [Solirubrobacteraceae bacterium]